MFADERIEPRLAARAAHADDRDLAAEVDEAFVDQRHGAERLPRGFDVARLCARWN